MIRHYSILLVFSLFLLTGCSFLTRTYQNPEVARAETLLQKGQNKEAAAIYKQLAEVKSSQQNKYRLFAAEALIRTNDIKQAKQYLNMIDVSALDEAEVSHLRVLQAQIDLSQGNAETALTHLKAVEPELLNNQTKIAYYQSQAFAYSLTGDAIQSVQALINLSPFIRSPKELDKHYEKILSTLSALSEQDLQLKQSPGTRTLNGWMSLARIFKLDPINLDDNLLNWRKLHPLHPANSAFLANYVKNYQLGFGDVSMIAVFLPESGAYSAPAAVIKDGFMKAYKLAQKNGLTHSEIRFYDSVKNSMASLYQQAIKDGAHLVVGPLDKKDIKALVSSTELTIPVLALNHVEGLNAPKLYQFGLSPIDDAEQITLKAHRDGHQNAVFLVPKTEQGKRFSSYFTDNWQAVGGKTANVQSYEDSKNDFPQLEPEILKPNANPAEVDVIIINAYAKPARSLYVQLLKNQATAALPVYATSQIYLGDANPARDKALDGITFCDVPWVFAQAYSGELSKLSLYGSWQNLPVSYLRLLPMGIDAYNLIGQLSQLKKQPYNGATGRLKLDGANRITRELFCAKFVDGIPKAIDFASETPVLDVLPGLKQPDENNKPAAFEIPKQKDNLRPVSETNDAAP